MSEHILLLWIDLVSPERKLAMTKVKTVYSIPTPGSILCDGSDTFVVESIKAKSAETSEIVLTPRKTSEDFFMIQVGMMRGKGWEA